MTTYLVVVASLLDCFMEWSWHEWTGTVRVYHRHPGQRVGIVPVLEHERSSENVVACLSLEELEQLVSIIEIIFVSQELSQSMRIVLGRPFNKEEIVR